MARIVIIEAGGAAVREARAAIAADGYEIEQVTWEVAREACARPGVHLVLAELDADPGRAALLERITSREDDLPVLAMGPTEMRDALLAALEAGAVDCIELPAHPRILRARVASFVRQYIARQAQQEMTQVLERRARALESTVDALRESDRVLEDAQRRQRYLATHDGLTGLPNRVLFHEFAQKTLAYARRHGQSHAVIALNLDRFQGINDNLGHGVGDQLLEQVGQILQGCVRRSDMVARLGGDEFAVLLVNIKTREAVGRIAEKIERAICAAHSIEGHELFVTPSMGIALSPGDGDTPESLISHAVVALKQVKQRGRGMFQFYAATMAGQSLERMKLEYHLREAIERDQLLLHYQPQIDVRKGVMVGCEALVRWNHPDFGMVSPGEFIPIAEGAGLIGRIGEWVLREACRQKRVWEAQGLGLFPVSVNVSFRQLRAGTLDEIVRTLLGETGLDPTHLDLEITENSIMDDLDAALSSLERLERMGVRISIDDFGTGYSSLSVLGKFPAHTLKIDQAFVRGIEQDGSNAAITRTVVAIAHELGLDTLAEGVETEEQMHFLADLGVTRMQGYLFDRPLPAAAFADQWAACPESPYRVEPDSD